jgi:hypothetical protein
MNNNNRKATCQNNRLGFTVVLKDWDGSPFRGAINFRVVPAWVSGHTLVLFWDWR